GAQARGARFGGRDRAGRPGGDRGNGGGSERAGRAAVGGRAVDPPPPQSTAGGAWSPDWISSEAVISARAARCPSTALRPWEVSEIQVKRRRSARAADRSLWIETNSCSLRTFRFFDRFASLSSSVSRTTANSNSATRRSRAQIRRRTGEWITLLNTAVGTPLTPPAAHDVPGPSGTRCGMQYPGPRSRP